MGLDQPAVFRKLPGIDIDINADVAAGTILGLCQIAIHLCLAKTLSDKEFE